MYIYVCKLYSVGLASGGGKIIRCMYMLMNMYICLYTCKYAKYSDTVYVYVCGHLFMYTYTYIGACIYESGQIFIS